MADDGHKRDPSSPKRMVTRDELDELARQRNQAPNPFLKYEPKGPINGHVKTAYRAELQGRIVKGERKLSQASERLDDNHVWSRLPGRARADWLRVADKEPARNTPKYHGKTKSSHADDQGISKEEVQAVERREARLRNRELSSDVSEAVERREARLRAQQGENRTVRGPSIKPT